MPFSFFIKPKKDHTLVLLIDIGSASVGGALTRIVKGKEPHIIWSIREDIALQRAPSSPQFLLGMLRALDRVLKNIQLKTKDIGIPGHIFCTLASPWIILKSRQINIVREVSFEVTPRVLEEFLNQDIERLKNELIETIPPKEVRIVEKNVTQIKLNGYDIKNPYGQTTFRMEITMTVGVSSQHIIQNIEQKLGHFFHTTSISVGAFSIAAFSAVRDIFPAEENFLFLDITGETTDVVFVSNNRILGTASFQYGKNFFIREISAQLRTINEEAISLFKMFLLGTLDSSKNAKIESVIRNAETEWLVHFEKSLTKFSDQRSLPATVFFTADTDMVELFLRLIKKTKSGLGAEEIFNPHYLDQMIVAKFASFESEVIRDPFIVVGALFASKKISQT